MRLNTSSTISSSSSSSSRSGASNPRMIFLWTMLFTMGFWMFLMVNNNTNRAYNCALSRREQTTDSPSSHDDEGSEDFYNKKHNNNNNNNNHNNDDCFIEFNPDLTPNNMALCFWAGKVNFGDTLGPAIVKRVLERHFDGCSAATLPTSPAIAHCGEISSYHRHPCFLSIGSVLQCTRPGDVVWGAGVNYKHFEKGSFGRDAKFNYTLAAVRGPRTETLLRDEHPHAFPNGDHEHHPQGSLSYGDPGFLVPTLFPSICAPQHAKNDDPQQENICFVPHYKELGAITKRLTAVTRNLPDSKSFTIISPEQDWTVVVPQLCQCTHMVSQSLHGLVIADALGIPNIWYQSGEHPFKYEDYYRGAFGEDYLANNVKTYSYDDDLHALLFNTTTLYSQPIPAPQRHRVAESILEGFPVHLFQTRRTPRGTMAASIMERSSSQ